MKRKFLSFAILVLGAALLAGCGNKTKAPVNTTTKPGETTTQGTSDPKTYTYRGAANSLPTSWNVHTYQSNDANTVLGYTEDALYDFDYNANKDGYVIIPHMAKSMPIDVSSKYVGTEWGIKEGETGRAYKIELRDDLKFDNGDPITAQTFVDSIKWLLNPQAANYRADNVYSGSMKIANAANYAKGGLYGTDGVYIEGDDDYKDPTTFEKNEDGVYMANGKELVYRLDGDAAWGATLIKYKSYLDDYIIDEETHRVKIFSKADEDGNTTWILTRSVDEAYELDEQGKIKIYDKDEENVIGTMEEGEDGYIFKDTDGNVVTRRVNEAGTAYEYVDKDGNVLTAWAGCGPKSLDYDFFDLEGNKISRHVNEAGTAWVYVDKDGNEVEAWAGSAPKSQCLDTLEQAQDKKGFIKVTDTVRDALQVAVGILQAGSLEDYVAACEEEGIQKNGVNYAYVEWEEFLYYGKLFDVIDFDTVGFKAVDGNIEIILEKELSGFYLNYALCTSFYLVHNSTYESCIKMTDGVYSNDYGTSVAKYIGFGPYKLTSYVADSEVKFEKNPYWYGYNDAENADKYQTTNISFKQVSSAATRLEMFLKGEIDSYGLQAEDMEDYQTSDWTYFTEGDSTWFVAINPSMSGLTTAQSNAEPLTAGNEVNKTVLTIKEFRMALSFSIDRQAYALALDPLGGVAKALYGNMIISDPENGTAYRTTEEAKDVIVSFWGLTDAIGEGKDYADKDEAIASITGYDLAGAKELFTAAYNKAVEDELISAAAIASGKWEVQIMVGQPGSGQSTYYNNGYVYLSKVWADAVKDTPFEGHLTFKQSQPLGSTGFSAYLKNNTVDILFGVGWTGSALDPYGLMEAYVSPQYQYDPAWDTAKDYIDVTVTIDGATKTLRASVYDWGKSALSGDDILATVVVDGVETEDEVQINCGTTQDPAIRLAVLSAVEKVVLEQYDMIPVNLDSSANLKGKRIVYGTEEYVYGVGRGGMKYMTYVMSDAEWAAYVQQQGGTLNYK